MQNNQNRFGLSMTALSAAGLLGLVTACHRPEGAMLSYTGETQTYYSTELSPKTIVVVDTRSGEPVFEIAVPPGKQLVFDFVEDGGDDPVETPALMRYEIMERGQAYGRLRNSVTVPAAHNRRVDLSIREGVEYAEEPPEYRLRPDQPEDRPDWWTPRGGPMDSSEEDKTTLYDG